MVALRLVAPGAAFVALVFAGCSGATATGGPPRQIATAAPAAKTTAIFSITIPLASAATKRAPAYISPSTQSIAIAVGTATPVSTDLTPSSPNCTTPSGATLTCTVTEVVAPGMQTFTVKSYDEPGGTGDVLSDATATTTITAGIANTVTLTLNGDVAQILVTAATVPACVATSEPVVVTAEDAKGNIIVGPGVYSNAITLSDSNTTHTKLSATSIAKPGDGATVSYDGSSPGFAIIGASASGVAASNVTPLVFSPGPTVCREYPIEGTAFTANPLGITTGSDGNLYAAEEGDSGLAEIAPEAAAGTNPTQVPLVASGDVFYSVNGIVTGADENLWVSDAKNGVQVVTPGTTAAANVTNYQDGTSEGSEAPIDIASGPDGNLWLTDNGSNQISRISTSGTFTDFTASQSSGSQPYGIALSDAKAGGDGRLWYAEHAGNRIAAISTSGTIAEFALPTADAGPTYVCAGPGLKPGDPPGIWFSETAVGQIGFIATAAPNAITEFAVPAVTTSEPEGIVAGLDGNIYFADYGQEELGRLIPTADPSKAVFATIAPLAQSNQAADTARPVRLTVGPDGNIYFTDFSVTDGTTTGPATYTGAIGYLAY